MTTKSDRSLAALHKRVLTTLQRATHLEGLAEKRAKHASARPTAGAIEAAKRAAERAREAREAVTLACDQCHRADTEARGKLKACAESSAALVRGAHPKPKVTKKAPKKSR